MLVLSQTSVTSETTREIVNLIPYPMVYVLGYVTFDIHTYTHVKDPTIQPSTQRQQTDNFS